MASRKPRSVWTLLERLGHPLRGGDKGDREETIQHIFEMASRVTVRSDDGKPIDGDVFLVETFEALGGTKDWPACGSSEWVRLREVALRRVVARLAREGLLDAIAVGRATDAEGEMETPAAKDEGSASDGEQDGGGSDTTGAEAVDVDMAQAAKDENPNPRTGVQVGRALIRRCQRNPKGLVQVRGSRDAVPGACAMGFGDLPRRGG